MTRTNRDLYLAIVALQEDPEGTARTLESYLLALWSLVRPLRDQAALSVDAFLRILDQALTAPAPPFDESWRGLPDRDVDEPRGFAGWEALVIRQIRDLREMDEAGMSPDRWRYLLQAPRGSFWYHCDPDGYLEAAAAGAFGGWEVEEDGEVTVPTPVFPMHEITWDDFREFLHNGQYHE